MKHLLFLLLLAFPLFGQGPPDCKINFSFTATGRVPSAGFPNGTPTEPGCITWTVVLYNTGFTVVSLDLESAPDNAGIAGTWVTFSGTLVAGINPNTTITQAFTVMTGYNPWVSLNLTTATGTGRVSGTAYGWKNPGFTYTSTAGGGPAANVNLIQVGGAAVALGQAAMAASIPVVIANNQSAVPVSISGNQNVNLAQVAGTNTVTGGVAGSQGVGGLAATGAADAGNPVKVGGSNGTNDYNLKVDSQGNNYGFLGCTSTAEVALSGTGYTEIVIGTAAQVIQVCKVFVTSASAGAPVVNTFTVASATITTCAGATELYNAGAVTGIDNDWGGALRSLSGASICVKESTANSDKVTISYSKAAF